MTKLTYRLHVWLCICHLCAEYCYVNSESAMKDLLQKALSQQYVLV